MTLEKFLSKINKNVDDCWIWTAYRKKDGYGWATVAKKNITAHRLSWVLHNGEIHNGLCVLHKCDVRSCCNPDHLYLGTHANNNQDAWDRKRQPIRTKIKLSVEQVKEIKELLGTVTQKELGKIYGVLPTTISNIAVGRSWSWV